MLREVKYEEDEEPPTQLPIRAWYPLPPRKARKAKFPPGRHVYYVAAETLTNNQTAPREGEILEVEIMDVGVTVQRYKLKDLENGSICIVEEDCLAWVDGTPVWWTYAKGSKPQTYWIHQYCTQRAGERLYTLRETREPPPPLGVKQENENDGENAARPCRILSKIPESALEFNYIEFLKAREERQRRASASSSNQQQQQRRQSQDKLRNQDKQQRNNSSASASNQQRPVRPAARPDATTKKRQASPKSKRTVAGEQQKQQPTKKTSSAAPPKNNKQSPANHGKNDALPVTKRNQKQKQSEEISSKQQQKHGKSNQAAKKRVVVDPNAASTRVPRRASNRSQASSAASQQEETTDNLPQPQEDPQEREARLRRLALRQPRRHAQQQPAEDRRHEQQREPQRTIATAHGTVVNETPNHFSTIRRSTLHNIERAQDDVREYIRKHGKVNPYRASYGGLGQLLHQKCWHWMIQGQCFSGCPKKHYHQELSPTDARKVEAALKPAISNQGPIFLENGLAAEEAAQEERSRRRRREELQADDSKAGRNTWKKLKLDEDGNGVTETMMLPACFGEEFFRSVLAQDLEFTKKLEEKCDCTWELQPSRKGVKLELIGTNVNKLIQCRWELERILCNHLPDQQLMGKFLMDLERLNQWRNTDVGNRPVLEVRWPGAKSHKEHCWMTEILVSENDNGDDENQQPVISSETAHVAYNSIYERYKDQLSFQLYPNSSRSETVIPSHVIAFGKDRMQVEKWRGEFLSEATFQAEGDEFEF